MRAMGSTRSSSRCPCSPSPPETWGGSRSPTSTVMVCLLCWWRPARGRAPRAGPRSRGDGCPGGVDTAASTAAATAGGRRKWLWRAAPNRTHSPSTSAVVSGPQSVPISVRVWPGWTIVARTPGALELELQGPDEPFEAPLRRHVGAPSTAGACAGCRSSRRRGRRDAARTMAGASAATRRWAPSRFTSTVCAKSLGDVRSAVPGSAWPALDTMMSTGRTISVATRANSSTDAASARSRRCTWASPPASRDARRHLVAPLAPGGPRGPPRWPAAASACGRGRADPRRGAGHDRAAAFGVGDEAEAGHGTRSSLSGP